MALAGYAPGRMTIQLDRDTAGGEEGVSALPGEAP